MPCHRVWLGRVLVLSLILSALECHHGTKASSIYRYPGERNVLDEDLDSLIEEFRKIGQRNHHDEIAKEKLAGAYRVGHRSGQGYGYDVNYGSENEGPRRYYSAVRGQKLKMMPAAWDRGEGLVEQANVPPRKGLFGKHRQENPTPQDGIQDGHQENVPQEFREESMESKEEMEHVDTPVHQEEHIEKDSNPSSGSDVKIAPVPDDIKQQDQPTHPTPAARQEFDDRLHPVQEVASMADIYFLAVVAGCSVAGLVGLVVAGVCWYRLQKNVKAASEVEYPAYGITGPTKGELGSPGDRKLAQSAQMYHYQHQKQQMIALEKANGEMKDNGSEDDSDEENEEGDYTVYECPGLAPTGEMEVKNPLFSEETPVTPTPDDRREMK